jgi:hypothetical protein
LVGISYQPKNAYALVSLSSGAAAQVVREGDLLTAGNGSQIKIGKIQQTQIDAHETGGGSTRSLMLPDIIGYAQTTGNADGGGAGENAQRGGSGGRGRPSGGSGGRGAKPQSVMPAQDATASPEGKSPIIKLED